MNNVTDMNRRARRKVINHVLKDRNKALSKEQYGLGLIVTNLMIVVMFYKWTFTLMDRRAK